MGKAKFTRAQGASSGVESYLYAGLVILALTPFLGFSGVVYFTMAMFAFQVAIMSAVDREMIWTFCTSQAYGVGIMRNASIGFAECVRPGGKPTKDHALNLYFYPPWVTSIIFSVPALYIVAVGPILAFIRLWYPEHQEGVNRNNRWALYKFLVRHPLAIQGEGPSNGDGLASLNGAESIIYPVTKQSLIPGPKNTDYWFAEGTPRLRDMFHDKLFNHRFFESHGAPHPKLVAEVHRHKVQEQFLSEEQAPKELIWKPRYSTMGLGVEWFTGWGKKNQEGWAPSDDPYVIEELIVSTEYKMSEWYRMTTLWDFDEKEPKSGYNWRTRNQKGDTRVQTDIIGGAYCVTRAHRPWVGPDEPGMSVDPRTGKKEPLDPQVEKALTKAITLMKKMHMSLGKHFWSIGWDVMIRDDQPMFIEFNINNGFFLADHTVAEAEQMAEFYGREFRKRMAHNARDKTTKSKSK